MVDRHLIKLILTSVVLGFNPVNGMGPCGNLSESSGIKITVRSRTNHMCVCLQSVLFLPRKTKYMFQQPKVYTFKITKAYMSKEGAQLYEEFEILIYTIFCITSCPITMH